MRSFLLSLLFITAPLFGYQSQEGGRESVPFQWLSASGETRGVKFDTHKLQPLSLQHETGLSVEIEEEVAQVDSQTTRITRKAYNTSVNGARELTETSVEEIRKMPGDRVRAVHTITRKDVNGRLSPVQREIQDIAPAGADAFQTKRTLFLPGPDNSLVEKEQIQQVERRKTDKSVEIERTRFLRDIDGTWKTAERRTSRSTVSQSRNQTDEQVYQPDVNNNFTLTQQLKVTEWKDASGERHWQSETYSPNMEGKFKLGSRITITQKQLADGRQETSEVQEQTSPAAPNEGLKLVRKIVENTQRVGSNQTQRQLEVLEPDLNGGWRNLYSQESVEVK